MLGAIFSPTPSQNPRRVDAHGGANFLTKVIFGRDMTIWSPALANRGDVGEFPEKYESCPKWPEVGLSPSLVNVLRGGISLDRNPGRFCITTAVFQNRPISAKTTKFSLVGLEWRSARIALSRHSIEKALYFWSDSCRGHDTKHVVVSRFLAPIN